MIGTIKGITVMEASKCFVAGAPQTSAIESALQVGVLRETDNYVESLPVLKRVNPEIDWPD